jgi:endo-1,4-beta-D-glucanase Y
MPVAAGSTQELEGDVRKMGEEGCVRVVGTSRQWVSSWEQTRNLQVSSAGECVSVSTKLRSDSGEGSVYTLFIGVRCAELGRFRKLM